jgi:hypothetical protein
MTTDVLVQHYNHSRCRVNKSSERKGEIVPNYYPMDRSTYWRYHVGGCPSHSQTFPHISLLLSFGQKQNYDFFAWRVWTYMNK